MMLGRLVLAVLVMSAPAFAQEWKAPRKANGAPDLEGVWTNITATPLERPAAFDSLTTTEERAVAFVKTSREAFLSDDSDDIGGRQSEWWEMGEHMFRIGGQIRTSIIVEPASGKMPFHAAGRARLDSAREAVFVDFDGPEGRPATERCLAGGSGASGAPYFPSRYNNNHRIVQTPDHVAIFTEQSREVRIIRLGDAGHRPPGMRRWMGYSTGRWEGDTLVVETQGFHPGDAFKPSAPILISENARVTERFTRISPDEILYQFDVEDPDVFSQTWRGEQVFRATTNRMFEYACHEGNYSMPGMLAGGREFDRRKAAKGR